MSGSPDAPAMRTVVGNSFMSEDRKPPRAIRVKTMPSTTVAARTCNDRTDGFENFKRARGGEVHVVESKVVC